MKAALLVLLLIIEAVLAVLFSAWLFVRLVG